MRSKGKNIELKTGKVVINYNDEGPENTAVLIFIHGLALNKSIWQKQEAALKDDYRVIAYDVRGHGKSQSGKEDFSIELFTDDLIHFMDVLTIDKAIICGLSMGGYIALRAIEKYPERFTALILCDTQCVADTHEAKEKRMRAIENIKADGKEGFALQNAKNIFSPESFTTRKQDTDAVVKMAVEMEPEAICNTLLARWQDAMKLADRLDEIKVPALILVGQNDKLIPPEQSQFMFQKIKGSQMHILENAAHLSNVENEESFNKCLKGFSRRAFLKKYPLHKSCPVGIHATWNFEEEELISAFHHLSSIFL